MHTISSYRGNRSTNTHTQTHAARLPVANMHTDRTDNNTLHCAAKFNTQYNKQNTVGEQWSLQANNMESKFLAIAF